MRVVSIKEDYCTHVNFIASVFEVRQQDTCSCQQYTYSPHYSVSVSEKLQSSLHSITGLVRHDRDISFHYIKSRFFGLFAV